MIQVKHSGARTTLPTHNLPSLDAHSADHIQANPLGLMALAWVNGSTFYVATRPQVRQRQPRTQFISLHA